MAIENPSRSSRTRSSGREDPLRAALVRKREWGGGGETVGHRLMNRGGLRILDVVCTSGPHDAPFEEAHSVTSIAVVLSGTFSYRSDRGRALMTPGSLLIGNPRRCFTCSHDHGEGDRCLAFMFEDALFERIAADAGVRRTDIPGLRVPFVRSTAPLIASAVASLREAEALEEIGIDLAHTVLRAHHDACAPKATARDERRVAEVVRHIEGTFEEPHALLELARRAGLSPFHFLRVFRRIAGVSPHQMLLRLRLNAAALRLRTTAQPITDIAYSVGFDDLSNFIRSFRTEFGTAPSLYRAAG
jgi:AraC family transcriptional regulator